MEKGKVVGKLTKEANDLYWAKINKRIKGVLELRSTHGVSNG